MIANLKTAEILATNFSHGSKHDLQLFKNSHRVITVQTRALADAGYQGLADLHLNSQTLVKKIQRQPLSPEQKTCNRALSRQRILIKNILRKLKIFRILSDRYRNRHKRFGLRFNLIAAINNLELKSTC